MGFIRGRPELEVELIEEIKTRIHTEINTIDHTRHIFANFARTFELTTKDGVTRTPLVRQETPLFTPRTWQVSKRERDGTAALTVLGPWMILRPRLIHTRPMILTDELDTGIIKKTTYSEVASTTQGRAWDLPQLRSEGSQGSLQNRNQWVPQPSPQAPDLFMIRTGQNLGADDRAHFQGTAFGLTAFLKSKFVYDKNRPWGMQVSLNKMSPVVQQKLKTFWAQVDDGGNILDLKSFWSKFLKEEQRFETACAITIGAKGPEQYIFLYTQGGNITLFSKKGTADPEPVQTFTGRGKSEQQDPGFLCFYPLGNKIHVFNEKSIPTDPGVISTLTAFEFDEPVDLAESEVEVRFYGGSVDFSWADMVHAETGTLDSPTVFVPFLPESATFHCEHIGKASTKQYPITVPETAPNGVSVQILIPEEEDMTGDYDYLSDVFLGLTMNFEEVDLPGVGPDQECKPDRFVASYRAVMTGATNGRPGSVEDIIYSPAVSLLGMAFFPPDQVISMPANPQISQDDVVQATVHLGVEDATAEVVLNNRQKRTAAKPTIDPPKGNYTHTAGEDQFTGVKVIRIRAKLNDPDAKFADDGEGGQKGFPDNPYSEFKNIFFGYITKRTYSRPLSSQSWARLTCVDRMKQVRDSYCINVPIMDGYCHLAAFYLLAKEAGFADEDILLYQSPFDDEERGGDRGEPINLLEEIDRVSGGPDSQKFRNKGCWAGHVEGFPEENRTRNGHEVPGMELHMTLPKSHLFHETPMYDFKTGTPVYDSMQQIRRHSFWYLYCNHFGNLVYCPPQWLLQETPDPDAEYVEVDAVGKFNEVQRALDAIHDTEEARNSVMIIGLAMKTAGGTVPIWQPDLTIKSQDAWPNNPGDFAFHPYRRFVLMRNPKWNDPVRNKRIADEMFHKVTRERIAMTLSAWGRNTIFPYGIFIVNEEHANETGVNQKPFIMSTVRHDFEAGPQGQLTWWAHIGAEIIPPPREDEPGKSRNAAEGESVVSKIVKSVKSLLGWDTEY